MHAIRRLAGGLSLVMLIATSAACSSGKNYPPPVYAPVDQCSAYSPTQPPILQEYKFPYWNARLTYDLPKGTTLVLTVTGNGITSFDHFDAPAEGGKITVNEDVRLIRQADVVQSSDWKQELEYLIVEAHVMGASTIMYSRTAVPELGLNPCVAI